MPTKIGLHYNKIGVGKTIYFLHGMGLDGHSMAAFYEPRYQRRAAFCPPLSGFTGNGKFTGHVSIAIC